MPEVERALAQGAERRGLLTLLSGPGSRYIGGRVLAAIVTAWVAATLDFALPRLAGGDPAQELASTTALGSPLVAKALSKEFGLTDPNLAHQYVAYFAQLLHGNLGFSYEYYPQPVSTVVLQALPYTLALVLSATIISFAVGWALGIVAAWRRGSSYDRAAVGISFWMYALPYFWMAMLLVYVFAFHYGWFPLAHALPEVVTPIPWYSMVGGAIWHAVLPVASLVIAATAGHLLVMRNNMITVLHDDYMALARAKGVSTWKLVVKYGARNALLPSFTGLVLSLGTVVGGALVTEEVFSYPGLGFIMYNAITNHDYPVIQGSFLMLALAVIAANLVADLLYPVIDPRVRLGSLR